MLAAWFALIPVHHFAAFYVPIRHALICQDERGGHAGHLIWQWVCRSS